MKGRGKKGFTLTETLAAVLIVTLLTAVLAAGASAAVGIHGDALFASRGDLLAATLNTALGDVLHYAVDITEGDPPAFQNAQYGLAGERGSLLAGEDPEGPLYGQLYLSNAALAGGGTGPLPLVGGGAYSGLRVEGFTLTYDGELFTGGYTITDGAHTRPVTFTIRPVNSAPRTGT